MVRREIRFDRDNINRYTKKILKEIKQKTDSFEELLDIEKSCFFDKLKEKLKEDLGEIKESKKDKYGNINKVSGVYVVWDEEGNLVYVGESDHLYRRLWGDIIYRSNNNKILHSVVYGTIRDYLIDKKRPYKGIKIKDIFNKNSNEWVEINKRLKKLRFSWLKTDYKETAFILEGILIREFYKERKNNKNIIKYNKVKDYQKKFGLENNGNKLILKPVKKK